MTPIATFQYTDMVRYSAETGILTVWGAGDSPLTVADVAAALPALAALAQLDAVAAALGAGYTLVLAARAWHGRPTESQRAAIIQAVERMHGLAGPLAAPLLDEVASHADAALLNGKSAESAILEFLSERMRRTERAANRCGRHGAAMLDPSDRLLVFGFGGPALLALLAAAPEAREATLLAAGFGAAKLVILAQKVGFGMLLLPDAMVLGGGDLPTLMVVTASAAALDGAALVPTGAGALIVAIRAAGVPCYLLVPNGPLPNVQDIAALATVTAGYDVVAPNLVSAFITDRGMYRPAMLARYLSDTDAPLDVIPLLG